MKRAGAPVEHAGNAGQAVEEDALQDEVFEALLAIYAKWCSASARDMRGMKRRQT
jgi:hypothetical protein